MISRRSVLCAAATLAVCSVLAFGKGKPPDTPGGGGDEPAGTIYFTLAGALYTMDSDGSGKTAMPSGVEGVPSRELHGGNRWFLDCRFVSGTYPDGAGRRELFAVREDGDEDYTVQLTDDADLEPSSGPGLVRWTPGDGAISWHARQWESGSVVTDGVYVAEIEFDSSGDVLGLGTPSSDPVVEGAEAHDWSPDGTRIVSAATGGLLITTVSSGSTTLLETSGRASSPTWSPEGGVIAFITGYIPCSLAAIGSDGSDETVLVAGKSGKKYRSAGSPVWGPEGTHLIFLWWGEETERDGTWRLIQDVNRVAASGGDQQDLTSDVDDGARPVGWR